MMKKTMQTLCAVLLVLVLCLGLAACGAESGGNLWADALYTEDTELGEGAKTITVAVEAEEKSVTFTVRTDAETVGDALMENGLLDGDEGEYGLYVKVVDGMTADYDVDQSYWAFYINDEYAMTGVDCTEIDESAKYRLAYEK